MDKLRMTLATQVTSKQCKANIPGHPFHFVDFNRNIPVLKALKVNSWPL